MKTNKKISQAREKSIGKQIGGRAHIASGALWFQKGDVSNEFIMIEDKFTKKDNYNITLLVLDKIDKESKKENKIPILSIGFESHKLSFACVNVKYCKEDIVAPFIESTEAKSFNLNFYTIKERYFSCFDKYQPIQKIKYTSYNKEFYIYEWDSFIENLSSIIYY